MCGESVYGRMKDFYGQSAFYHGGAINGFMSDVYYFPKLDISIGVFGEIWARYRVLISGE